MDWCGHASLLQMYVWERKRPLKTATPDNEVAARGREIGRLKDWYSTYKRNSLSQWKRQLLLWAWSQPSMLVCHFVFPLQHLDKNVLAIEIVMDERIRGEQWSTSHRSVQHRFFFNYWQKNYHEYVNLKFNSVIKGEQ